MKMAALTPDACGHGHPTAPSNFFGVDLVSTASNPNPQKAIPPGVGESSKRLRPWVWLVAALDIAVALFFLGRFLYRLASGWTATTYDIIALIFVLFGTLIALTFQLIIGALLIIALCQPNAAETVRYLKFWIYGSYVVNAHAMILVITVALSPEWILGILTACIVVFRTLAFLTVRKFMWSLALDWEFWETQRRILLMDTQYHNGLETPTQQHSTPVGVAVTPGTQGFGTPLGSMVVGGVNGGSYYSNNILLPSPTHNGTREVCGGCNGVGVGVVQQ